MALNIRLDAALAGSDFNAAITTSVRNNIVLGDPGAGASSSMSRDDLEGELPDLASLEEGPAAPRAAVPAAPGARRHGAPPLAPDALAARPGGAGVPGAPGEPVGSVAPIGGGIDRSRFASEIARKPWLRERMAHMVAGEVGLGRDARREQIQLETAMNRAQARGISLEQALWSTGQHGNAGYYPNATFGARSAPSEAQQRYFESRILAPVLAGSDEGTRFLGSTPTGNASQLGFAGRRLQQGYYSNGRWYSGIPGSGEMFVTERADAENVRHLPRLPVAAPVSADIGRAVGGTEAAPPISPYAKKGVTNFTTDLGKDEPAFRKWVKEKKIPFDPDQKYSDYDMRGFWRGLQTHDPHAVTGINPNDEKLHFSDWWKTPYHKSFSNESQWADPATAPHWDDKDRLILPNGKVIYDERAPKIGPRSDIPSGAKVAFGYDRNLDENLTGVHPIPGPEHFPSVVKQPREGDPGMEVKPESIPKQPLQQVPEDQLLPERPNFYKRKFDT